MTVLGAGAVGHAQLGAVRRRRHGLAVLKALGFTDGNAGASIGCQALSFAVIAVVVGLPTRTPRGAAPRASLFVVPGAGHAMTDSHPAEVARLILN